MNRQRPETHLLGADGPSVELPGWACAWMEQHTNLQAVRVQNRGADPGIDDVLRKVHYAAHCWQAKENGSAVGSADGTSFEINPEPAGELTQQLETGEAAQLIGITDRAVRKACTEQRLPAVLIGGRWRIERHDALNYQTRTAA